MEPPSMIKVELVLFIHIYIYTVGSILYFPPSTWFFCWTLSQRTPHTRAGAKSQSPVGEFRSQPTSPQSQTDMLEKT